MEPELNMYHLVEGDDFGPITCTASNFCNGTNNTIWITPSGAIIDNNTVYIQNITMQDFGQYVCAFENSSMNRCSTLKIMVSIADDISKY